MSEQEVCSNFQIDLTAAFGICKNCKLPKIQHKISNQPAKSPNSNFADKKNIFQKNNPASINPEKQNENQKINDFPQKIKIKESDEQKETCKNFQVDLTGDFGKCKNCKQPKINHENFVNVPINNNVLGKNMEKKVPEDKLVVNAVPPRRATQTKPEEEKLPCNDFKLSLAGEYGICANCKFSKHQHSDEAIFKKTREKGNSITNKPPEETKSNEIKILPKEEKKMENFKVPEKKETQKINNLNQNQKAIEKTEESVPCKNFKLDLAGEFGKCQNCKFNKTLHAPEALIPKPLESKKSLTIPKNEERMIFPEPKLSEKKEETNQVKDEKNSTNIKPLGQNLQKRDSFNVNLKKTFEHEKVNQFAAPNIENTEEFVKCEKFEIDLLGEFGVCKNCKNLKNKHNPEALQQNKKSSLVMKAPPPFLNANDKEKPKESSAALEINKTKKDSVKDKAMILENLELGPFGKGMKNDVNKNSNGDNESEIPKANSIVSENSKFETIRESSDKFEILKDSDAKTTMPQKKPKSSAAFVPDLRKSNISFEKKITPITVNSAIENANAYEKKDEKKFSNDRIEEETMKKKKPYTIRGKETLHEENEDFTTTIPPPSHPPPPQFSNNLNEEETLKKKKSFNVKKPLFDDDDEELEIKGKNNNIKPAIENNPSQAKKKVLFSDSEESEQNSSEEDSDEEDKKKKMEMKAKFNKALSNRYD